MQKLFGDTHVLNYLQTVFIFFADEEFIAVIVLTVRKYPNFDTI